MVRETEALRAYYHPRPSYAVHILIVPKQAIRSLMAMESSQSQLLSEVLAMVQELVEELRLEDIGYRLIVNGGPYQEIPQLHFHLISD
jgi:histidine triad (HIT) family protein